jgi:hypothetical protein
VTQSDLRSVSQKENIGQATGEEKDYRAAVQPISRRTLVWVALSPARIMEIDLPGGEMVWKRGWRLCQ